MTFEGLILTNEDTKSDMNYCYSFWPDTANTCFFKFLSKFKGFCKKCAERNKVIKTDKKKNRKKDKGAINTIKS